MLALFDNGENADIEKYLDWWLGTWRMWCRWWARTPAGDKRTGGILRVSG
jgi:hypothetical protein